MMEVLLTYYHNVINKQSSKLKQNNVQLDFPVDNRIKLEEGGLQTIRDREQFKKDYFDGKYPTYNFGNTVEGVDKI